MRVLVLALALFLAGCESLTGPGDRACGRWPFRLLSPAHPERFAEVLYVGDLAYFEDAPDVFRVFEPHNPWIGFFRPGERLGIVRAGDISGRHVLVRVQGDRMWTVVEEVC